MIFVNDLTELFDSKFVFRDRESLHVILFELFNFMIFWKWLECTFNQSTINVWCICQILQYVLVQSFVNLKELFLFSWVHLSFSFRILKRPVDSSSCKSRRFDQLHYLSLRLGAFFYCLRLSFPFFGLYFAICFDFLEIDESLHYDGEDHIH